MKTLVDRNATLLFQQANITAAVFGRGDLDALPFESEEQLRERERAFLSSTFGLDPDHIYMLRQEHGNRIVRVDAKSANRELFFDTGDALYTLAPERLLCMRTADCIPVFFFAKHGMKSVAGIIHAGWKGIDQQIVRESVRHVSEENGMPENSFRLFMGPCIGGSVYEVRPDVADRFTVKTSIGEDRFLLDLPGNALLQFPNHGEYTEALHGCTYEDNDRFYSHRRGDRRRNLNVIMIGKTL